MIHNTPTLKEDPFLDEDVCYERLHRDWEKHGSIVVAVDFDNTVFDLHDKGYTFPRVWNLLRRCKELGFKIVVFSASPKERHDLIRRYMADNEVEIDGINCDVVKWVDRPELDYSGAKVFYNVLLCDRAGLPSAYKTLLRLVFNIENINWIQSAPTQDERV